MRNFALKSSNRETIWAKLEGMKITKYTVVGETDENYYCKGYPHNFFIKKNQAFDTKDDLIFKRFVDVCMHKLSPEMMDGTKFDPTKNKSNRHGIKELNRYLRKTKKQNYSKRFMSEYAEYLI